MNNNNREIISLTKQETFLNLLTMMAEDDIEALTKAIILFETGIDEDLLDDRYDDYIKSDGINLLDEFFYEY